MAITIADGRGALWQWDTGRRLRVGSGVEQIHYQNRALVSSVDVDVGDDGTAIIPDELLQDCHTLTAYVYVTDDTGAYTMEQQDFIVHKRAKPAGYVYTPTYQMTLQTIQSQIGDLADLTTEAKDTLVAAINEAAASGGDGSMDLRVADGYIQYSTDGSSTWQNLIAMADLKGADGKSAYQYAVEGGYTGTEEEFAEKMAAEVDLTPYAKKTEVPTKTSQLTNDSGFLTSHQDISGKQDKATLEADVSAAGFTKNTGTYSKPTGGIPKADLAEAVQTSLSKADTALQSHQSLAAYRTAAAQDEIDSGKVDKVTGKGLSTNDYTASAKAKVDAIPANPKYTDTVYDDTALKERVATIEGKESAWDAKLNASELPTAINTALAQAKASGEFDGADGKSAYAYAQDGGYTGTEAEFAEKLAQEPLIGTTNDLTPTQVYDAVSAGIPVKVQYTDSTYGLLSFTAFNLAESLNMIVSQTIVYGNVCLLAELIGYKSDNTWVTAFTILAQKTDIPSALPNPHALTFTGAVTGTYNGSTAKTVNIPSAVTDDHINSLIDTKLGVIENGAY